MVKSPSAMWETGVRSLGREDPLEKDMGTHSSILAWRIPWTKKPCLERFLGEQAGMGRGVYGSERSWAERILLPCRPPTPQRSCGHWSSSKSQGKYSDHSESEIGPVSGLSPDRCNILGLSVKVVWWWEVDPTWLEKGLP